MRAKKNSVFGVILLLLFLTPTIYAQEPTPCDPCSSSPEGAYARSSGTAPSGVVHQLSCRNGYWEELPVNLVFDPENTCFTPNPFSFVDAIAEPTTLSESDIVQVTGMVDATPISIVGDGGPSYRICGDAICSTVTHTWSSSGGNIDAGEFLQLRLTSGAAENNVNTATVTVGTDDVAWNVRTADRTPNSFSFTDQFGVTTSTLTVSNIVWIRDMDYGTSISISGDGSPAYRICADSGCSTVNHTWTSSNGSIDPWEYVQVRLNSSATESTSHYADLVIGSSSTQWEVMTNCAATPSPGDEGCQMADGSIYAGLSPDGNVAMYATPSDAPANLSWNDGSSNWVDTAMTNCTDDPPGTATTCQTGEANTTFLVSLGGTGTPAPYEAAEYCDGLSAHGHNDWYLPAQDELQVLHDNKNIGAFDGSFDETGDTYWSSSEEDSQTVRITDMLFGNWGRAGKQFDSIHVRCVRRD